MCGNCFLNYSFYVLFIYFNYLTLMRCVRPGSQIFRFFFSLSLPKWAYFLLRYINVKRKSNTAVSIYWEQHGNRTWKELFFLLFSMSNKALFELNCYTINKWVKNYYFIIFLSISETTFVSCCFWLMYIIRSIFIFIYFFFISTALMEVIRPLCIRI